MAKTSPATNIPKTYGGKGAPVVKQGQTKGSKYGMDPSKKGSK